MKKNKKFIVTTIILSALVPFVLTGCFDPIYNTIRKDVKPEKATVSGDITSITRYNAGGKEFLVLAANGGIRYKKTGNNSHGNWETYDNLPFSLIHYDFGSSGYKGERILKVIADDTHLYVATVQHHSDSAIPIYPKLWTVKMNGDWSTPESEWKELTSDTLKLPIEYDGRRATSQFNIFSTNDIKKENRHAYLRIGDPDAAEDKNKTPKYYELNNGEANLISTAPTSADPTNDKYNNSLNSAVYFGGVKFFNSPASVTNATAADAATYIYYSNDNDLFYSNNGTTFTKALDAGSYIGSMAISKDAILLGCGNPMRGGSGGIKKTSITNGVPGTSLTGFTTNAPFQMPSYYMITCLLNETPEKTELQSAFYSTLTYPGVASSGNSKNEDKGLWSFYPERGNWNRE